MKSTKPLYINSKIINLKKGESTIEMKSTHNHQKR